MSGAARGPLFTRRVIYSLFNNWAFFLLHGVKHGFRNPNDTLDRSVGPGSDTSDMHSVLFERHTFRFIPIVRDRHVQDERFGVEPSRRKRLRSSGHLFTVTRVHGRRVSAPKGEGHRFGGGRAALKINLNQRRAVESERCTPYDVRNLSAAFQTVYRPSPRASAQ